MSAPRERLPVALLGATGVAGRQALAALAGHPWFEIVRVGASAARAGRRLGEVASAAGLPGLSDRLRDLVLQDAETMDVADLGLVFSMLPSEVARRVEARCARTTPVVSTAAAFRDEPDTPLLMAGVNGGHAALLARQRRERGWRGCVAPGPNCTAVGLVVTLAPLDAVFGVRAVSLTSMQAISGAGASAPAVADAVAGNLLPWIEHEEEKVERETRKILGRCVGGGIEPAPFPVSATCTRVAVEEGHTLSVSVALARPATPDEAASVLAAADPWRGRSLPSAPARWIEVRSEPDRPQPRLDALTGGGMTTVVGRLRPDPAHGGLKYVVLSHNAVLGAAGGAVLAAEDLLDRGLLHA